MKIKGIVGVVQIETNDELETQIQYAQSDRDDMVWFIIEEGIRHMLQKQR